jgi:hypothetical protein
MFNFNTRPTTIRERVSLGLLSKGINPRSLREFMAGTEAQITGGFMVACVLNQSHFGQDVDIVYNTDPEKTCQKFIRTMKSGGLAEDVNGMLYVQDHYCAIPSIKKSSKYAFKRGVVNLIGVQGPVIEHIENTSDFECCKSRYNFNTLHIGKGTREKQLYRNLKTKVPVTPHRLKKYQTRGFTRHSNDPDSSVTESWDH